MRSNRFSHDYQYSITRCHLWTNTQRTRDSSPQRASEEGSRTDKRSNGTCDSGAGDPGCTARLSSTSCRCCGVLDMSEVGARAVSGSGITEFNCLNSHLNMLSMLLRLPHWITSFSMVEPGGSERVVSCLGDSQDHMKPQTGQVLKRQAVHWHFWHVG